MTERNELRNKHIKGNLVKSVTRETSIECFRQCSKLIRCSSMSYNKQNKICYMYSRLNTYSDGSMEDGRMYYMKDDKKFTNSKAYIQGNRKQNTPEWEFDDETLISYMPWNLNQKQPEAYDQIFLCFNVADQGMWHDCIGTQLFRFVCERYLF
ncbi:unnamed protein product [Mytilus edulis]|uniref:C-type lectin domain-containing protein n=1 Tax=Mytilus edulis TaxID=6550 RepID=A0A8S3RUT9_MYTED|nr:unnamed protein product [Mytilus edulis]